MQLRPIAAIAVTVALVVTGCGGDDDDSGGETTEPTTDTTTDTTEAPDPTATAHDATFTDVVDAALESQYCYFRQGEVLVGPNKDGDPVDDMAIAEINQALADEFDPDIALDEPVDTLLDIRLYSLVGELGVDPDNESPDPLRAADVITSTGEAEAVPNYVMSFAPEWKFSPDNAPTTYEEEDPPPGSPGAGDDGAGTGVVAVLDTGFDPAEWPLALTPEWVAPDPPTDVSEGPVAGHGTFIAGILARLSTADVVVTRPDRIFYSDPDNAGNVFPATDDWAVATAIERDVLDRPIDVLNLSLGTYACGDVASQSDGESRVREPITTRAALLALRAENPGVVVTAAAGNDSHGPEDPAFYPAAWAVDERFLFPDSEVGTVISVGASGDADDGDGADAPYSNTGPWVVATATGTLVSHRAAQTDPEPEPAGWFTWSGTSFAAPCMAATIVNAKPTGRPLNETSGPLAGTAAAAWLDLSDERREYAC